MNGMGNRVMKRAPLICLMSICALSISVSGWAQAVGRGPYTEIVKGTRLCSDVVLDESRGVRDPGKVFWKVISPPRANGTQTVAAFVIESIYDRQSGDTKIQETRYDDDYATFFKRDPERKGMWLMISPEDGKVEATVAICPKKK